MGPRTTSLDILTSALKVYVANFQAEEDRSFLPGQIDFWGQSRDPRNKRTYAFKIANRWVRIFYTYLDGRQTAVPFVRFIDAQTGLIYAPKPTTKAFAGGKRPDTSVALGCLFDNQARLEYRQAILVEIDAQLERGLKISAETIKRVSEY